MNNLSENDLTKTKEKEPPVNVNGAEISAETSGTETAEVTETSETAETPEVTETSETAETAEVTETSETAETSETTETPETAGTTEATETSEIAETAGATGTTASTADAGLLEEVRALKQQLEDAVRRAEGERTRMAEEVAEFRSLYPEVSPNAIPPSVWDEFSRGVPLSASYARMERERERAAELARLTDARNRAEASPSAGRAVSSGYYTPDEVRAMSQEEVHVHYGAILDSMRHWGV